MAYEIGEGRAAFEIDPRALLGPDALDVLGGQRFECIEDVISTAELEAISERYKKVAGFDRESLKTRPSFV